MLIRQPHPATHEGIMADCGDAFQRYVSAADDPLVVVLAHEGAGQVDGSI